MSTLSLEEAREAYPLEEIQAEQQQIFKAFASMKFGENVRQTTLACLKKCGVKI